MKQPDCIYAICNVNGMPFKYTTKSYIARYILKHSNGLTVKHIKPMTLKEAKAMFTLQ